ncbi:MAG: peptide chain release factor 2 [Christensenellales bacterium]
MVVMDEYKQQLNGILQTLQQAGESLDLSGLKEEQKDLEQQMAQEGFWNDVEAAQMVNQRLKRIQDKISLYQALQSRIADAQALIEMAEEEGDEGLASEIAKEVAQTSAAVEELHLSTLLKGDYDDCDAVLSLHAGAGGTEAQDWTQMLYRMYQRYCEKKGYSLRVLDYLEGDDAGVKSVTFEVGGENAYGYLKAEKGVHRLVRISPFDSSSRRHTSFASLDVTPVLSSDVEVEINPDDIRVDTYRASGAGGQHVNKTDSAIRITHLPTGVVVQCQNERSQMQNRETAMRLLRGKLLELKEREQVEKMAALKGEMKRIEWGSQIRSYVFHPYSMVKDHRTGTETGNIGAVMDGEIDPFINAYLVQS